MTSDGCDHCEGEGKVLKVTAIDSRFELCPRCGGTGKSSEHVRKVMPTGNFDLKK